MIGRLTAISRYARLSLDLFSQIFYAAGSIILKGYSATVQNVNFVSGFACIFTRIVTVTSLVKEKSGAKNKEE